MWASSTICRPRIQVFPAAKLALLDLNITIKIELHEKKCRKIQKTKTMVSRWFARQCRLDQSFKCAFFQVFHRDLGQTEVSNRMKMARNFLRLLFNPEKNCKKKFRQHHNWAISLIFETVSFKEGIFLRALSQKLRRKKKVDRNLVK